MDYPDLTPEIQRARLVLLAEIFDRELLDKWSLAWFEQVERDARALNTETPDDQVEDVFRRLVKSYLALSSAHLDVPDRRLDAQTDLDPAVRYWAGLFLSDFHERHWEKEAQRRYAEGLDLATGEALPPGWLQLDVDEVFDAYKAETEAKLKAERDRAD